MRAIPTLAVVGLAALLLAVVLLGSVEAADVTISMKNTAFNPASKTVHRGDKVTWSNDETNGVPHNARSNDGSTFSSPNLDPGQTYDWVVPTEQAAVTINYKCEVHPTVMTATLTVENLLPSLAVASPAANAQVFGQVQVQGTASDDAGVTSVTVTLGSANATATLSGESWSATLNATGQHGPLNLVATAVDTDGKNTTRTVAVLVNAPPRAAIGAPAELNTAEDAAFTDNTTDDHTITSWNWTFGDGNASTERDPTHRYATRDNFTVTLNVTDDHGIANQTQRVVAVTNARPRGTFAVAPPSPGTGERANFTANVTDPDGSIALLQWEFGDGATANGSAVNHTYAAVGSYVVNLTAVDNENATLRLTRTLAVGLLASARPVVALAANLTSGAAPLAVSFTFNGTDPDGNVTNWTLSFGDGSASAAGNGTALAAGVVVNHTYLLGGAFEARLTAIDNSSTEGTASLALTVQGGNNTPPRAGFSVSPGASARKGQPLEFRDSSSDPDAGDRVVRWTWDFGDGTTPVCCNLSNVTHSFAHAGRFTVTLNVSDTQGGFATASVVVDVPGEPPGIILAANRTAGPAPLPVGFTVSVHDDGTVARWTLDFGDGTTAHEGTEANATVQHLYDLPGSYAAFVNATDDDGLSARSATVTISVGPRQAEPLPLPPGAIVAVPTAERLTMRFTAASGADGDVTARWDFGDGRSAAGREVVHAYDAPGPYNVTLTVQSATGSVIARGSLTVIVEDAGTAGQSRVAAERASGLVRLRWEGDPRAAGYQVWRSDAGGRFDEVAVVTSGTSYSDQDIADGVAYVYQVTFFSATGEGRLSRLTQLNNTQAFRSLGQARITGFVDSDGDGVGDSTDAFPLDALRTSETGSPFLILGGVGIIALAAALGWRYRHKLGMPRGPLTMPLTSIPGLEPEHAAILHQAGIADAPALAAADLQELGKRSILGPRQLGEWQAIARLLGVPGLQPHDAQRLARAGVRAPDQLARVRAEVLAPRLNPPEDPARVAAWVRAAWALQQGRS